MKRQPQPTPRAVSVYTAEDNAIIAHLGKEPWFIAALVDGFGVLAEHRRAEAERAAQEHREAA